MNWHQALKSLNLTASAPSSTVDTKCHTAAAHAKNFVPTITGDIKSGSPITTHFTYVRRGAEGAGAGG